jgi:hypothetical protein
MQRQTLGWVDPILVRISAREGFSQGHTTHLCTSLLSPALPLYFSVGLADGGLGPWPRLWVGSARQRLSLKWSYYGG